MVEVLHLYVCKVQRQRMKQTDLLDALVRCELKARYSGLAGWQLSAKGALPVILVAILAMVIWRQ